MVAEMGCCVTTRVLLMVGGLWQFRAMNASGLADLNDGKKGVRSAYTTAHCIIIWLQGWCTGFVLFIVVVSLHGGSILV